MAEQNVIERDLEELQASLETMDAGKEEIIGSLSVGDVVRQGDLYLVNIGDTPTKGEVSNDRQLAVGNTIGARHIAEGSCIVRRGPETVEALHGLGGAHAAVPVELVGGSLEIRGKTTITHPDHGHKTFNEPTNVVWYHQRMFAKEVRRVAD